ncbi:hypothetical protein Micbo1qcDRAFT_191289 [Microdochium bolleyi]|uniref:Dicer-like protein 2 n=1 Tax=Microdochium bolleyi TaxID=196109 RepID=A0A136JHE0_9PEZI|nr:hypothetical protein Micbo1qcDRAFT_191289 [Microdochium bolleyi]
MTSDLEDSSPEPSNEDMSIQGTGLLNARAYQIEMFELSLKKNIIVAMPTGSGKTQIAVLRLRAEVERSPPGMICWFLAPTVALCEQQHAVFSQQMPAIPIKLLTGSVIEKWSDTTVWDKFLQDARIVVSTYQVLRDAIMHAFVRFDRLALIVIDEAHNCRGKSAVVKIMQSYHDRKTAGWPVPTILGLTASPIMNSKIDGLEEIEQILDAVCRSPSVHREELLDIVKLPDMLCSTYAALPKPLPPSAQTMSMRSLLSAALQAEDDLFHDPSVLSLAAENTEKSRAKLRPLLEKKETYTIRELRSFVRKAEEVRAELGPWAADYFITEAISHFQKPLEDLSIFRAKRAQKDYLNRWLKLVDTKPSTTNCFELSDKVSTLARQLLACPPDTRGIVFVQQTATVVILARLLSMMPEIRGRYRIGTMVGTSQFGGRAKGLGELHQDSDYAYLEQFRLGSLSLLIATNVLEEGIDVPACNLVVCFDTPANLKSFIQRRGRARKGTSKLLLLISDNDDQNKHQKWMDLEKKMKARYEDELRRAGDILVIEESELAEVPPLYIPSTGALLDFDQAKSHLQHVCTKLSTHKDADSSPYYLIHRTDPDRPTLSMVKATVVLPSSLPADLRRFQSERSWLSDKNAVKDAAFVAFKALYDSGLVNDNLMPLRQEADFIVLEDAPGIMEVRECFNPWVALAHAWNMKLTSTYSKLVLRILGSTGDLVHRAELIIPGTFPDIPSFPLFWDPEAAWTVELKWLCVLDGTFVLPQDQSLALMHHAFGHRFNMQDLQHVIHIGLPSDRQFGITHKNEPQSVTVESLDRPGSDQYLIRDDYNSPFFYRSWVRQLAEPDAAKGRAKKYADFSDQPWLVLDKWPKQIDFLRPPQESLLPVSSIGKRHSFRPVVICKQDSVPIEVVQLGTILPSIMHIMEIHLIAEKLRKTLLGGIDIKDISLIVTAISSSKAQGTSNYQRLEFLGDTLLKFLTTATLSANRPNFPEGYLTMAKNNIVSNAHLCRVTLRSGLDEYILTEPFAGRKWRPNYVEDLVRNNAPDATPRTRLVSTKTLADVVESLAGAAYLDGGWDSTTKYLRKMLPEVDFRSPEEARSILLSQRSTLHELHPSLAPLEDLCGYKFQNKTLLIEAVTHTKFYAQPVAADSTSDAGAAIPACASLERLEFLGDAILDTVVVQYLWTCTDATTAGSGQQKLLSHQQMHLLRAAAVNADLLGFLAMEWCISQERTEISPDDPTKIVTKTTEVPIWKFMRHSNPDLAIKQQLALYRHSQGRENICRALFGSGTENDTSVRNGTATITSATYPWVELAHLQIPKIFSDMVEALIGAVWTDSGSLEQCTALAERVGIIPVLRRLVADSVDVMHPKNKLGELIRDKKVRYEHGINIHGLSGFGGGLNWSVGTAGGHDQPRGEGDGRPAPDAAIPAIVRAHLSSAAEYTCKVFVDEELVTEVGGGLSKEEIITKAADVAYKVLLERWGPSGPPPQPVTKLGMVDREKGGAEC